MPDDKAAQQTRRIFLALWPNDTVRDQLEQQLAPLFKKPGPRRVPRRNWHITLAFLGNVSQQVYDCAMQQAGRIHAEPFALSLSTLGYWSRPRVVWVGTDATPDSLKQLVQDLNRALHPCGYQPEHVDYVPHLTVLRKATQAPTLKTISPVRWQVNDFVLVESVTRQRGSEYQVVQRWPLQNH